MAIYENTPEWKPNEAATYMKALTRKQASTIFKARSRMIKVKGNYKNGHQNHICRICGTAEETQQHILKECEGLPSNDYTPIENDRLFSEDAEDLQIVAQEIDKKLDKISEAM